MGDKIATHTAFLVSWGKAMPRQRKEGDKNWSEPGRRQGLEPHQWGLTRKSVHSFRNFLKQQGHRAGLHATAASWLGSAAAMSAMPPSSPSSIPPGWGQDPWAAGAPGVDVSQAERAVLMI